MNPIIAHVGSQPGSAGVHLPVMRNDDAKLKAEVDAPPRDPQAAPRAPRPRDDRRQEARRPVDASEGAQRASPHRRAASTARIPREIDRDTLIGELADEALGLGPLERFLADPTISEIMVVDPKTIYVEQSGKLIAARTRASPTTSACRAVIERIVTPLGRRIDESSPLVDARLKDGSRVNAIIRPLALRGSCITIRKFAKIAAHARQARRASAR